MPASVVPIGHHGELVLGRAAAAVGHGGLEGHGLVEVVERLDAVEELFQNAEVRLELKEILRDVADLERLQAIADGHGSRHDVDVLYELDKLMHGATHCGLGASACNPLRDTIAKFRPAYERRLQSLHFEPAFDLDAELSVARKVSGRDDPASHLETAE